MFIFIDINLNTGHTAVHYIIMQKPKKICTKPIEITNKSPHL